MNQQLYTILKATTMGAVFDLVKNAPKGAGLEAWRFDPATGAREDHAPSTHKPREKFI